MCAIIEVGKGMSMCNYFSILHPNLMTCVHSLLLLPDCGCHCFWNKHVGVFFAWSQPLHFWVTLGDLRLFHALVYGPMSLRPELARSSSLPWSKGPPHFFAHPKLFRIIQSRNIYSLYINIPASTIMLWSTPKTQKDSSQNSLTSPKVLFSVISDHLDIKYLAGCKCIVIPWNHLHWKYCDLNVLLKEHKILSRTEGQTLPLTDRKILNWGLCTISPWDFRGMLFPNIVYPRIMSKCCV